MAGPALGMGVQVFEPLKVLDKYEVIRRIAQGGMGEIFLARQVGVAGFNRLVILKSLLPELAEDEAILSSFLNEARIGATLNHPNIVAIYEIGDWEGVYFLAMEYVNGGGLDGLQRAAYKKQVGLPRVVSAQIIRDAALGLDHAHHAKDSDGQAMGIVHRDVTPQNLMVRLDGVVKVVDFGIAKAAGSDGRTQAGEVKGKLAYLSPEQIQGDVLDGRSDQFALGVVFWELITGRRLFNAKNPVDIFRKILGHEIPPPRSLDPGIPAELDTIVMKMLAEKPRDRYLRLADASRDIAQWVDSAGGNVDQVSQLVKHLIGDETTERTRDLTPSAVKIQGLTPAPRSTCLACGAKNTSRARFCADCGAPVESTGEASRKMIAAAKGQAPFPAAIPASVDQLLGLAGASQHDTLPPAPRGLGNALVEQEAPQPPRPPAQQPSPTPIAPYVVAPAGPPAVEAAAALPPDPDELAAALRLELEHASAQRITMDDLFGTSRPARPPTGPITPPAAAYRPATGSIASPAASYRPPTGPVTPPAPYRPGTGPVPAAPGYRPPTGPLGLGPVPAAAGAQSPVTEQVAPAWLSSDTTETSGPWPNAAATWPETAPTMPDVRGTGPALPGVVPALPAPTGPWVGRRDVLMEAGRLVREATSGNVRALVLTGDAGIGRTATLARIGPLAAAAQTRVVQAAGRRHGPRRPLDLYLQILSGLFGRAADGPVAASRAEILRWASSLGLDLCAMRRVEAALGGDVTSPVVLEEQTHLVTEGDLANLLRLAAQQGGVCLLLDDLHWADPASRRVLARLLRSTEGAPIAIFASASTRFDLAEFPQLELKPLLDAEVEQLLQLTAGGGAPLPQKVVAKIVGKARGNPGFALDLLELLQWEGALHNLGGRWNTTDSFESLALPANPNHLAMGRVRAAGPEAEALLKTAAAVGTVFETTFVGPATRRSGDVRAGVGDAVSAQLIEQVDHGRYRFRRGIYADVAGLMCEGAESREIHQRLYKAMAALAPEDAAIALDAAGHLVQGEATSLLGDLGLDVSRRLVQRGLIPEAAQMYTATVQGLLDAHRGQLDDEGAIHHLLGAATESCATLRRHQATEAIHVATRVLDALAPTRDPLGRARLLRERALGHIDRLRFQPAEQDLDNALELVGDLDPGLSAALLFELGNAMAARGDLVGAAMQVESCIRLSDPSSPDAAHRMAALAGIYRRAGRSENAKEAARRAVGLAEASGDVAARFAALLVMAETLAEGGEIEAARLQVESAQRLAEGRGDAPAVVKCMLTLVEVERTAGSTKHAEVMKKRAMTLAAEIGFKRAVLEAGADVAA